MLHSGAALTGHRRRRRGRGQPPGQQPDPGAHLPHLAFEGPGRRHFPTNKDREGTTSFISETLPLFSNLTV